MKRQSVFNFVIACAVLVMAFSMWSSSRNQILDSEFHKTQAEFAKTVSENILAQRGLSEEQQSLNEKQAKINRHFIDFMRQMDKRNVLQDDINASCFQILKRITYGQ